MFRKRVWIPLFIFLIVVVGCGLFYSRRAADQEPIKVYKSTPSESAEAHPAERHFHADGTYHPPSNPATGDTAKAEAPAKAPDFVNPTSTSTNPLFPDGVVPEHLQCPQELVGLYLKEVDREVSKSLKIPIVREIILKYYPSRPLREIWSAYIDAEKWYYANADPERAVLSTAAGRIDWAHQLTLDFPEILLLTHEDPWRFTSMRHVELGHWPPDYNLVILPDGRTFRTDDDKRYEFTWSTTQGTPIRTETTGGSFTTGGNLNGEFIRINLDEITDEELEELSGWDYNINPYTTGAYKLEYKPGGNQ